MGKPNPGSLYGKVRDAVRRLGECTNQQILAEVGHHITAAKAAVAGQREVSTSRERRIQEKEYAPQEIVDIGRRRIINCCISSLLQRGHIERVRQGVYRDANKKKPASLADALLAAILQAGTCTINQAIALVSDKIPSSHAITAYQGATRYTDKKRQGPKKRAVPTLDKILEYGKRRCVSYSLYSLKKQGKIRHVRPGVYGLPEPMIFEEPHQDSKVG